MLNEMYKQFKSGTDIRGVASEGIEGQPINLTDDVLCRMADGFVLWLAKKVNKAPDALKIAVGRDSRISGPHIMALTTERFCKAGAQVICCGLASTPSMFMTTVELGCDGALQITASHHPFNRNGLKFFTRQGGLEGSDIEEILTFAQDDCHPEEKSGGVIEDYDFMTDYAKGLRETIKRGVNAEDYDHPLRGFHIVVDAGNGAGGFYADKVLAPLGADTTGSRYLDPDGMFPNHVPNPEDATAMASICEAVKESHADLGVIFDTDVDRGGAVDNKGNEINRNRLVAVAAAIALEGNDGGTDRHRLHHLQRLERIYRNQPRRQTLPLQTRLQERHRQGAGAQRTGRQLSAGDRDLRSRGHAGELFPRRRRVPLHQDHHQGGSAAR